MDTTMIVIIVAVAVCLLCVSSSIGGGIYYTSTTKTTTTLKPTTTKATTTKATTAPPTGTPAPKNAVWNCMGPNNTRFDSYNDFGKGGIVREIAWSSASEGGDANFCSSYVSECGNNGPCTLKRVSTY